MARSRLYCLLFSWHWHLVCVSPIFASNCLKLNFKLFFLTDVSNYCEERKIKLSVNVYIKIARNLGSNFWNFGSNFLDFWQFFSNLLAFQWATFHRQYSASDVTVGILWRKVVFCRDFILLAVATFWVMSLVGIYPGRASSLHWWVG